MSDRRALDPGYTSEVDAVRKDEWHGLLLDFDDVSFYQTWSYGGVSWGDASLSHLVLRKDGVPVALAQLRIARVPLLPAGFAYLTSGPLWRRKGEAEPSRHLANMLRALRNEYVLGRGYLLHVIPRNVSGDEELARKAFADERFAWSPDPQETVFLDLRPPLEEIRKNLRRKWRQTLDRSLRNGLEIRDEDRPEPDGAVTRLIREMMARKRYVEFGSMESVLAVNRDLPAPLRLRFAYCTRDGELVSVLAWFSPGAVGMPLVAATGDRALPWNPSYPLWWKMVESCKSAGARAVDLAGISRENNPGGYLFKTGLAGESRTEKHYLGQFQACRSALSRVCFGTGLEARNRWRGARRALNGILRKSRGAT